MTESESVALIGTHIQCHSSVFFIPISRTKNKRHTEQAQREKRIVEEEMKEKINMCCNLNRVTQFTWVSEMWTAVGCSMSNHTKKNSNNNVLVVNESWYHFKICFYEIFFSSVCLKFLLETLIISTTDIYFNNNT